MLTKQQLFDGLVVWIFAQNGEVSLNKIGPTKTCVYRRESANFASTRCAIGMYIHQELPDDRQGCTVNQLNDDGHLPESLKEQDVWYLRALQAEHDYEDRTHVRGRLISFAQYHYLSCAMVDALFPEG